MECHQRDGHEHLHKLHSMHLLPVVLYTLCEFQLSIVCFQVIMHLIEKGNLGVDFTAHSILVSRVCRE